MALYAGFHNQILPLRSGVWRFCREPSGFDLAYKKDMTNTFATQFSSGRPKVEVQGYRTPVMGDPAKGDYDVKGSCSEKRIYAVDLSSLLAVRLEWEDAANRLENQFSLAY